MRKLLTAMVCLLLFSGCSVMQKKADGSHFNFGSNNNSEASIWLEKIIVDGKWNAPSTGALGCAGGNVNGASGIGSVSYDTPAPQEYIYLEWYSWKEMARMKARVELPDARIINDFLLNSPWPKNKYGLDKAYFIIDFRPNHKVWVKLADTSSPKSQDEIMILAEGKGIKTDDVVKDYIYFEEGKDYSLNCLEMRRKREKLGYYSSPLTIFNKWYTDFIGYKEEENE